MGVEEGCSDHCLLVGGAVPAAIHRALDHWHDLAVVLFNWSMSDSLAFSLDSGDWFGASGILGP